MIATSIEQSEKLLELGINYETADMCWNGKLNWKAGFTHLIPRQKFFSFETPAWSLSALLDLMPKPIKLDGNFAYPHVDLFNQSIDYFVGMAIYKTSKGKTLIDAAVEMIEWLVKNGHLIKEDEK